MILKRNIKTIACENIEPLLENVSLNEIQIIIQILELNDRKIKFSIFIIFLKKYLAILCDRIV